MRTVLECRCYNSVVASICYVHVVSRVVSPPEIYHQGSWLIEHENIQRAMKAESRRSQVDVRWRNRRHQVVCVQEVMQDQELPSHCRLGTTLHHRAVLCLSDTAVHDMDSFERPLVSYNRTGSSSDTTLLLQG